MVDISRKTSERISCKKNTANKNSTVRITKKKKINACFSLLYFW